MNWLNSLLRKPPASSNSPGPGKARRKPAPPPPPTVDIDALRREAAAAVDPQERLRRAVLLGQALGSSGQAPAGDDEAVIWLAAVNHAADKSLALAWLARLDSDEQCAEVAREARFAEVRLAAAQRITDGSLLEEVARAAKNKDKGVYRHCADLLRLRREAQSREQQAGALARALQSLLDQAPVSVSHLLELERDFKALAPAAPAPDGVAVEHCGALLAQANARVLAEADAQRAAHALCTAVAALAAEIAGTPWPELQALAPWRQRAQQLGANLQALAPWLAGAAAARAAAASLNQAHERLEALEADLQREQQARQFLESPQATAPDAPAQWAALAKPADALARQHLEDAWQQAQTPAPPAVQAATPAPEPEAVPLPAPQTAGPPLDLDNLRTLIDGLEQAIENGQLGQAENAAKQIKSALGAHTLEGRLDARLQRAQAQLGRLRGWAQWGATKKREDLIAAAEELRAGVQAATHNVEHLAVAIPALREEWRRLNAQGPSGKGQWESFDTALEAAYQPVAAFRAEEAQRRAQARAAREAQLEGFAAALAAIDWERPDAGTIEAQREQMIAQWRAGPHAGYRDERALRVRFDALVQELDGRVAAIRAAEIARREQLIDAVAALTDLPDLRQAMAQAKHLQERWRTEVGPLRLRRGEEQKLWQRFRTGCDAVFARRDAERDAERARREQRRQAQEGVLDALAASLETADAPALRRALAQFRNDWGSGPDADGPDTGGPQERRARELQRQAQLRIDALEQESVRQHYNQLAAAAAPVDGLDPDTLEKGRERRQGLLIDMEIALGLASPGDSAETRRRRQLEQLQNRFRPGATAVPVEKDPEKLLVQWYAVPAPADAQLAARIGAVVERLLQARLSALKERERPAPRSDSAAHRSRTPAQGARAPGGDRRPRTAVPSKA